MPIIINTTTYTCSTDLLNGKVNFAGGSPKTYKMLLISSSYVGNYNTNSQNVGTPGSGSPSPTNVGTDEVAGPGYTSGGVVMSGVTVSNLSGTLCVDWSANPVWTSATFTTVGSVLYEASTGDIVACFDFGGPVSVSSGTFTIVMPPSGFSTSALRLNP